MARENNFTHWIQLVGMPALVASCAASVLLQPSLIFIFCQPYRSRDTLVSNYGIVYCNA